MVGVSGLVVALSVFGALAAISDQSRGPDRLQQSSGECSMGSSGGLRMRPAPGAVSVGGYPSPTDLARATLAAVLSDTNGQFIEETKDPSHVTVIFQQDGRRRAAVRAFKEDGRWFSGPSEWFGPCPGQPGYKEPGH